MPPITLPRDIQPDDPITPIPKIKKQPDMQLQ